eukprot:gene16780-biopygen12320
MPLLPSASPWMVRRRTQTPAAFAATQKNRESRLVDIPISICFSDPSRNNRGEAETGRPPAGPRGPFWYEVIQLRCIGKVLFATGTVVGKVGGKDATGGKVAASLPLAAWRQNCGTAWRQSGGKVAAWRHGGKVAAKLAAKLAAWRHGGMAAKWGVKLAAKWRHGGMVAWRQSGGNENLV